MAMKWLKSGRNIVCIVSGGGVVRGLAICLMSECFRIIIHLICFVGLLVNYFGIVRWWRGEGWLSHRGWREGGSMIEMDN